MINKIKPYLREFTSNDVLLGFLIGAVFPLSAWIINFTLHVQDVSVFSFFTMHAKNPILLLVDAIPFIVATAIYYINKKKNELVQEYEEQVSLRDQIINKNAEFAKKIGEGEFEEQLEIMGDDDNLGRSLLIMRDNLLANYEKESEQNWISEGKDLISDILRIHNRIDQLAYEVLVNLIEYINVIQGALYLYDDEEKKLTNIASYAYNRKKLLSQTFHVGEGLIGQCAYEMDYIYRTEIPEDYVSITSGILGDQKPSCILLVPLISDEKLQGVLEFASLEKISETKIQYLRELAEVIARTIFNLKVNETTEHLLKESQEMTRELQENEEQLRQNAEEMRATQEELERSNEQLERQIQEVENAQKRLHSLLENASEVISIYDKNMNIKYVSPSVNSILGFSPDEFMKGKDMEQLTRQGKNSFKKMLTMLLENPTRPISIQYTYIHKSGDKIFMETTGRNLLHDPAIDGIILNSQDITARKKAEKEERLRSRMQSLSENSLDLIIRLNNLSQCFYANPVVEDYLNTSPIEMIDKKILDLPLPDIFTRFIKDIIEQMSESPGKYTRQITLPIKIGEKKSERIMNFTCIPEFADNENNKELETILIVGHDITDAKRIEREIQDKNKKIEDSINYAQRIQNSILPNTQKIREVFPNSFIYYKPRDVVSGDFPWFFRKEDNIYIAAVDCTGHGVPGALLSFIGYFTLNNVVGHDDNTKTAAELCDEVHYNVRSTLNQDQPDATQRDGMDIAFCKINLKKMELQYAGAHRPLFHVRNNELTEYKGDRKAIGGIPHMKKEEKDFTNYLIKIKKGDKIFLFSDGLPDQIGGTEGKKYSPKRMRNIILSHPEYTMSEYNDYFSDDFLSYKKNNKQLDDVLVIGIDF